MTVSPTIQIIRTARDTGDWLTALPPSSGRLNQRQTCPPC